MKPSNHLFISFTLFATSLFAQTSQVDMYLSMKPSDIKLQNSEIQEYGVVLRWQNLDPISGNIINTSAIAANYISGLDSGKVSWSNVFLYDLNEFNQELDNGKKLEDFDQFVYKPNFFSFTTEKYYTNIAPQYKEIATWFILDALQMEGITSVIFDSLLFNVPYYPSILDTLSLKIENGILFKSQSAKFIWAGITKLNEEICAVIEYESLQNPVKMDLPGYAFQGRSLYWGEVWISLADKQYEYANMIEDIIINLKNSSFPNGQIINMQREIVFNKLHK